VKSKFAGRSMDAQKINVAVLAPRQLQEKWPELIAAGIFGVLGVFVGIIFWEGWLGFRWFRAAARQVLEWGTATGCPIRFFKRGRPKILEAEARNPVDRTVIQRSSICRPTGIPAGSFLGTLWRDCPCISPLTTNQTRWRSGWSATAICSRAAMRARPFFYLILPLSNARANGVAVAAGESRLR
jgi:hypothetical protein